MDKVKIGFVGAGGMGSAQMAKIAARSDAQIEMLFEVNVERGKEVLKELSLDESILVDSYQKIIDNPNIDAVWLVSPNGFHGEQSIQAMEAGKHVFCEKPCATTFDDYCTQIELEGKNPALKTYVNYLMCFDPMQNDIKGMIARDELGKITQIQINYRYPINVAGPAKWKLSKEIMGDSIGMGTVHSLSAIVHIMSPQAKPVAVYATELESQLKGFESPPIHNIVIKFDNGATGFCFGDIETAKGFDLYHSVSGTKGGFVFENQQPQAKNKVRFCNEATKGEWVWPLNEEKCKADGFENLIWSEDKILSDTGEAANARLDSCIEHFIVCVKENKKSFLSFGNSSIIAQIGWAAQMSAATGKEIALPLDIEEAKKFFAN